jgi:DNA-binding MarR family transcriptional regulator
MKTNETYLRFLELTKLLEKTTTLPLLEPVEKRMLEIVALANIKNKRLSVKDMMSMSDISSPATMHKNIHALVDKGWIFLEETEDARRWQLQLTKETLKYFDKLGVAVQKSIK